MGNYLEIELSGGDSVSEDLNWLLVNNDSMFNESYLAEVHELLVKFASPEVKQGDEVETTDASNKQYVSSKAKHLLEIFSKSRSDTVALGSMKDLHVGSALKNSAFNSVQESRARLMRRIQLVSRTSFVAGLLFVSPSSFVV
jgi:hypothetical protein